MKKIDFANVRVSFQDGTEEKFDISGEVLQSVRDQELDTNNPLMQTLYRKTVNLERGKYNG